VCSPVPPKQKNGPGCCSAPKNKPGWPDTGKRALFQAEEPPLNQDLRQKWERSRSLLCWAPAPLPKPPSATPDCCKFRPGVNPRKIFFENAFNVPPQGTLRVPNKKDLRSPEDTGRTYQKFKKEFRRAPSAPRTFFERKKRPKKPREDQNVWWGGFDSTPVGWGGRKKQIKLKTHAGMGAPPEIRVEQKSTTVGREKKKTENSKKWHSIIRNKPARPDPYFKDRGGPYTPVSTWFGETEA